VQGDQLGAAGGTGRCADILYAYRRIYRRGFRDLECCDISALGYAQIWDKG